MAKRSPIKLVCEQPWLDIGDKDKVCQWVCTDESKIQGARFIDRQAPRFSFILHRPAKTGGKGWQLTSFDEKGPWGDIHRSSCNQALKDERLNQNHKLVEVIWKK